MLPARRLAVALLLLTTGAVLVPLACSSSSPNPPAAPEDAGPPPPDYDVYRQPDLGTMDTFVLDMGVDLGVDAPTDGATDTGEGGGMDACAGSTDPSGCGGLTCPPCGTGLICLHSADCQSLVCGPKNVCTPGDGGAPCQCQAATCSDGVKNQGETDVDCGGPNCPKCGVGKMCLVVGDCQSGVCNMSICGCPPNMIPAPTAPGGDYCIDAIEVDKKDYNTFLIANPIPMNQPSYCAWNMDYVPRGDWPPTLTMAGYNGGNAVHYVNWCDAYAYCSYVGKHLCGAVSGGPAAQADANNANIDQWYNACSAEGVNAYPYNVSTYQPAACNGVDNPADAGGGAPWPELDFNNALLPNNLACNGGVAGIYNMSGDVAEWEDSCSGQTGATDTCYARGGSYASGSADLRCNALSVNLARNSTPVTVGFRCCQ